MLLTRVERSIPDMIADVSAPIAGNTSCHKSSERYSSARHARSTAVVRIPSGHDGVPCTFDASLQPRSEYRCVWFLDEAGVITGNTVNVDATACQSAPAQVRQVRAEKTLTICPEHADTASI